MIKELVAFIDARLDEDARDAQAASPGPWSPNAESDEVLADDGITVCDGFALSAGQLRATVQHIARHDPARVLADIAARRRLLSHWPDPFGNWSAEQAEAARAMKEYALRALALQYAAHPDYREEWRIG